MRLTLPDPSSDVIEGTIHINRSTKKLLHSIETESIAVVDHTDMDEAAAAGLIGAKVRAVINAGAVMSGIFLPPGPLLLLQRNIPLYEMHRSHFERIRGGSAGRIAMNSLRIYNQRKIIEYPIKPFTMLDWAEKKEQASGNALAELDRFVDNTISHIRRDKDHVLRPLSAMPILQTVMAGRDAVVVARGSGYRDDLFAITPYIARVKPVLIGVDGGADALLELGMTPDIVVGDMDSVSDAALSVCRDIVVQAYDDGRAPGAIRLHRLGLPAHIAAIPGTSEDMALLLAHEGRAELVVTVGSHTHMADFYEKGRKGMASTLLARLKLGAKLVDVKGLSKLLGPL